MFTGPEIAATITELGFTHVVWLPDSELGLWEAALEAAPLQLVRICREGEAWPLAAGLSLGGKLPLVMIQTTGLFESGDALRNVLFDLKLPIFAVLGGRSLLVEDSPDSAKRFAEPILRAWGIDYVIISSPSDKAKLAQHCLACRQAEKPGIAIIAEGKM